jgi:hypothetical protein
VFALCFAVHRDPLRRASCHPLCSAAQSQRTSTPALRSIQFP